MRRTQHQPTSPERLSELRAMPYREYLLTPEWLRKRFLVLNRIALNRCQLCNAPGPGLQVHHRDYSRLGSERMTDLIALCEPCHALADAQRRLAVMR